MRSVDPQTFFSEEEQQKIIETIYAVERQTAGEICVRIERECKCDVLQHCGELMHSLGICSTAARTGILIFISIQDHRVAIYGDEGIHEKIGNDGWNSICIQLIGGFQQGRFCEVLCDAIREVGTVLRLHFPATKPNLDEIPNKPSLE